MRSESAGAAADLKSTRPPTTVHEPPRRIGPAFGAGRKPWLLVEFAGTRALRSARHGPRLVGGLVITRLVVDRNDRPGSESRRHPVPRSPRERTRTHHRTGFTQRAGTRGVTGSARQRADGGNRASESQLRREADRLGSREVSDRPDLEPERSRHRLLERPREPQRGNPLTFTTFLRTHLDK